MSVVSIKNQTILVEVKQSMSPAKIEHEAGKMAEKMEQALRYVQTMKVCSPNKVRSTSKGESLRLVFSN
jgi:hypothetical protein